MCCNTTDQFRDKIAVIAESKVLPWKLVFGVACWMLWTDRNKTVLGDPREAGWSSAKVKSYCEAIVAATEANERVELIRKSTLFIGWSRPKTGWYKLNTDGSFKGASSAGAGGLIRNDGGGWCFGFTLPLPRASSALHAELLGIWQGLLLCWEEGISQLVLESDSKVALSMLRQEMSWPAYLQSLHVPQITTKPIISSLQPKGVTDFRRKE